MIDSPSHPAGHSPQLSHRNNWIRGRTDILHSSGLVVSELIRLVLSYDPAPIEYQWANWIEPCFVGLPNFISPPERSTSDLTYSTVLVKPPPPPPQPIAGYGHAGRVLTKYDGQIENYECRWTLTEAAFKREGLKLVPPHEWIDSLARELSLYLVLWIRGGNSSARLDRHTRTDEIRRCFTDLFGDWMSCIRCVMRHVPSSNKCSWIIEFPASAVALTTATDDTNNNRISEIEITISTCGRGAAVEEEDIGIDAGNLFGFD